jgi:hypothetical protein
LEVLHPHHKLDYFKSAKWDDEWIETAKQIVRDEFERTYKDFGDANSTSFNAKVDRGSKKVCSIGISVIHVNNLTDNPLYQDKEHFRQPSCNLCAQSS